MKYSLTIHELNASQVADIVNRVENEVKITSDRQNVIVNRFPDTTNEVANQNTVAATSEVDSIMTASTNQLLQAGKTGELDSAGLPWDERIHSGSKKKNADGKWKLRKNVDEALVASVEHEHKSAISEKLVAAVPAFMTPAAPAGQLETPAFLANRAAATVTAPATVPATLVANAMPPAPAAPPAPMMAQPPAPPARDFSGLMLQISKLFASKQISPDYPSTIVNRVNAGFGSKIATLTDVANDPRMVEYSWQCLEVDGRAA